MTRFRAEVDDKGHLKIITDGETVLNDSYEVVDLLNKQQEQLDLYAEGILLRQKQIKKFKEENEQLRKKNEEYKINWSNSMDIARLNQEATREFHRENEQLRRENKKKDIEIQSLNAHITNWLNETKIAKLYENEQYRTETLEKENEQLRQQLKEKQEDEKEYAREILRLNKLVKEYSEIRQLGGDY